MTNKANTTFKLGEEIYHAFPSLEIFVNEAGINNVNQRKKILLIFRNEGITSVVQLYSFTLHTFMEIGLDKRIAKKITNHLQIIRRKSNILISGSRLKEIKYQYLTTGHPTLDSLLRYSSGASGLRSKTVIEFYGPASVGKTQLMMSIAAHCIGKWKRKVVYIDSEGGFDFNRFESLCQFFEVPTNEIEPNLMFARVYNFDELQEVINQLGEYLRHTNVGLIVVDSIIDSLKAQYPLGDNLDNLQQRQEHLKIVMDLLKSIAQIHDLIVCYTNQVRASFDKGTILVPQGGNVLAHASDLRFSLFPNEEKSDNGEKISRGKIILEDCGFLPKIKTDYLFGIFGFGDPLYIDRYKKINELAEKHNYLSHNIKLEPIESNGSVNLDSLKNELF